MSRTPDDALPPDSSAAIDATTQILMETQQLAAQRPGEFLTLRNASQQEIINELKFRVGAAPLGSRGLLLLMATPDPEQPEQMACNMTHYGAKEIIVAIIGIFAASCMSPLYITQLVANLQTALQSMDAAMRKNLRRR